MGPLLAPAPSRLRGAPLGRAVRVAFVGQATFFEACSLQGRHGRLHASFLEFRAGASIATLLARLARTRPDVVIVFRPEIIPAGAFAQLPAATVGFLTEPLPRGAETHSDLQRRLAELGHVDVANFDRIISFDPLIADTAAALLPVWRSLPLPVADRFFTPPPLPAFGDPPRLLFVGRSTPHRERLLTPVKHEYDLLHVAFGVSAERLAGLLVEHDVGINVHNEPYPSFENRVCLHLAAGHLVLSEPVSPTHGLEPGLDFLEFDSAVGLVHLVERMRRFPGMWNRVRIRGRLKAEQFRASHVYARLISDLYADLEAFGSERA